MSARLSGLAAALAFAAVMAVAPSAQAFGRHCGHDYNTTCYSHVNCCDPCYPCLPYCWPCYPPCLPWCMPCHITAASGTIFVTVPPGAKLFADGKPVAGTGPVFVVTTATIPIGKEIAVILTTDPPGSGPRKVPVRPFDVLCVDLTK